MSKALVVGSKPPQEICIMPVYLIGQSGGIMNLCSCTFAKCNYIVLKTV